MSTKLLRFLCFLCTLNLCFSCEVSEEESSLHVSAKKQRSLILSLNQADFRVNQNGASVDLSLLQIPGISPNSKLHTLSFTLSPDCPFDLSLTSHLEDRFWVTITEKTVSLQAREPFALSLIQQGPFLKLNFASSLPQGCIVLDGGGLLTIENIDG